MKGLRTIVALLRKLALLGVALYAVWYLGGPAAGDTGSAYGGPYETFAECQMHASIQQFEFPHAPHLVCEHRNGSSRVGSNIADVR
jgi:hypothetical protein